MTKNKNYFLFVPERNEIMVKVGGISAVICYRRKGKEYNLMADELADILEKVFPKKLFPRKKFWEIKVDPKSPGFLVVDIFSATTDKGEFIVFRFGKESHIIPLKPISDDNMGWFEKIKRVNGQKERLLAGTY